MHVYIELELKMDTLSLRKNYWHISDLESVRCGIPTLSDWHAILVEDRNMKGEERYD